MKQGVLPFQYEEEKSSTGMTALSGLPAYLELAHAAGLRSSLEWHVGLRGCGQGWTDIQVLTSLIMLNPVSSTGQALAGGESVIDLDVLEEDEGFCRVLSPNPPMRSGLGVGTRGEGRGTRRPALDPINGAGGGLWLSLGAPMAVLGSGAGAGSAGQHAGEDNRGPGRCDSVGRLGNLVDVSGAVGAVRQAMAGLAIEPGRE